MILGADGFDLHPTGSSPSSLDGVFTRSTSAGALTIASGGRGGGQCLRIMNSGGTGYLTLALPTLTEVWISVALFRTSGSAVEFMQFGNGTGTIFSVNINASGYIEFRRGSQTGTLLATSTVSYAVADFQALSFKIKFDSSAGTIQCRCAGSGTLDIDASGLNTEGVAGGATFVKIGRYGANTAVIYFIDDFVWGDVSGSYNNTCPPDLIVGYAVPTGDVGSPDQDFTPSTGSDNYAMVDDVPHDSDTTYVESTVVGDRDRYTHSSTLPGQAIKALIGWTIANGGGALRHLITGSGGTEDESAADIATDASIYHSQQTVFETDPDTGVPWTPTGLADADMTFGQKNAA